MSLKLCIKLENPNNTYFAGQKIKGLVTLQNDKPIKIKEISIKLLGVCEVSWSKTENYKAPIDVFDPKYNPTVSHETRSRTVTVADNEDIISSKKTLLKNNGNIIELRTGTTTLPFDFLLPANLPSSFTACVGIVKYMLKAKVKRPLPFSSERISLPFTVNGIFDLNLEHSASLPHTYKDVKGSNLLACRRGQILFLFETLKSGFVPGETLHFKAEVKNNSNRKATGMRATLQQKCTFYAQGEKRSEWKDIARVLGPVVDEGECVVWDNAKLVVPSVPPTNLGGGCSFIDVQYFLMIQVLVSGPSLGMQKKVHIFIGNVPTREEVGGRGLQTVHVAEAVLSRVKD